MVKNRHQISKPRKNQYQKQGTQNDSAQFRFQLDALGLKIVHVTADGNCFFRCLADQLEGNEDEHGKYRAMVVQYIKKNRETFEPFIEDDVPFDEYCATMAKDGSWAGNMELQAASLATRSNLCIHQFNKPRWYIRNFDQKGTFVIHISYHDEEHYNSVRMKDDSCEGPATPILIKADAEKLASPCQPKYFCKGGNGSKSYEINAALVKLVILGSGCQNAEKVEHVLRQVDGDADVAVEFLIAEQENEEESVENDAGNVGINDAKKDDTNGKNHNLAQQHPRNSSNDKNIPRNKVCPCGSRKKYKSCCGAARATEEGKKQGKRVVADSSPAEDVGALHI